MTFDRSLKIAPSILSADFANFGAEIEAVVQGADRDAAFDTLTASIGAALAADRTLGGFCDWVEAEAPRPVDLPVEGAASLKAAVIPVVLHYSTADPLA